MERNLKLDYFKIILSLLVITVHCQNLFKEDSLIGWLISNGIARVAVPCFFIISGYYIHHKLDDSKILKKYLLHIFVVYIVWSLIYLPIYYSSIEPRSLITFAIMGYYHLWFLPALIIAILLLAFGKQLIKKDSILLSSGIILYLVGYMMETIGMPYRSFYNGLFFGYPFVALGYFLRKREVISKLKTPVLYYLIVFSFIFLLLESFIGYRQQVYNNIYLSVYVLSPAILLWIIKTPIPSRKKHDLGKLSAGIYYVHILVLTLIIPLSENDNIYKFPFIAIISIALSIFIILINKRIKIFL